MEKQGKINISNKSDTFGDDINNRYNYESILTAKCSQTPLRTDTGTVKMCHSRQTHKVQFTGFNTDRDMLHTLVSQTVYKTQLYGKLLKFDTLSECDHFRISRRYLAQKLPVTMQRKTTMPQHISQFAIAMCSKSMPLNFLQKVMKAIVETAINQIQL